MSRRTRTVFAAALALAAAGCSRDRASAESAGGPEAGAPLPPAEPLPPEQPTAFEPTPEPEAPRELLPPAGLPGDDAMRPEPVTFDTPDGVRIHASYWRAGDPTAPTVLFAHQARTDRSEWEPFVRELRERAPGIAILAIDLRGHGESLRAGDQALRWDRFQAGEAPGLRKWVGCTTDVQAAVSYLRGRGEGTVPRAIGLVGSSIGATSVIRAVALDGVEGPGRIAAVVALSPGLSYFSVPIRGSLETLKVRGFPLLAYAARDDSNDTVGAVAGMQELMGPLLEVRMLEEGGHGVAMARAHGEIVPAIVDYLRDKLGD